MERAAAIEAEWRRIDIWVNNAMATIFGAVSSLTGEQIKRAATHRRLVGAGVVVIVSIVALLAAM